MENKTSNLPQNKAMPYDALLGAVNSLRSKLYKAIEIDKNVRYQLQYADYEKNEWTLPIQLLDYRIKNFYRDLSLRRVKLIFSDGTKILLDV